MKPITLFPSIDRRVLLSSLAMRPVLSVSLRSTDARRRRGAIRCVLKRGGDQDLYPQLCQARHDATRSRLVAVERRIANPLRPHTGPLSPRRLRPEI
jgi:hypothetical protein